MVSVPGLWQPPPPALGHQGGVATGLRAKEGAFLVRVVAAVVLRWFLLLVPGRRWERHLGPFFLWQRGGIDGGGGLAVRPLPSGMW